MLGPRRHVYDYRVFPHSIKVISKLRKKEGDQVTLLNYPLRLCQPLIWFYGGV
jgi:hypothetical protein